MVCELYLNKVVLYGRQRAGKRQKQISSSLSEVTLDKTSWRMRMELLGASKGDRGLEAPALRFSVSPPSLNLGPANSPSQQHAERAGTTYPM